ncbi:HAL/PAL/TAL family ammonia-lyase [Pseudonocardia endophytica]|uniref:Histidine ammonia-lyase n=1 Tax=Pseudonocardia endophytica TaxID=401976 RepID=A0A4R1HMR9_PSEEN|nr:aromatic amino acid ammonia-lyase [Pseudonocardia endophytica]TCK21630.1 histidine ammonia-lyase [Pseudonocardia endophytica]
MTAPVACGVELGLDDVCAVARDRAPVELAPGVEERLRAERNAVDAVVDGGVPAYGVTTGLGPRSGYALTRDELAAFSLRTIRGRVNAVGEPLPTDTVRAAMLLRLGGIARGGSGASPAVARQLAGMLNAGVHPVVPRTGSIGAADLCQLAHVGEVVIGEGRAELSGEILDGAEALRRAGLEPLTPGPKDGLVLCTTNAVTAAIAALALADAEDALIAAQAVVSVTYEGFRANVSPLDPRAQAARPSPGSPEAAAHLLTLLRGGRLTDPAAARRVQDPISIRCASQVHGALASTLDTVRPALDAEINGSGDNPLVRDDGTIASTGNFHTPALALVLDTLALALHRTASLSVQRMQRLLTGRLSGLPDDLSAVGPGSSGFGPLLKIGQALLTEIRHRATPVSLDSPSGADGVEDDASNASYAAARLPGMLRRFRLVLAVEALAATQAVELAAPAALGDGPSLVTRAVREAAAPLTDDRASSQDVERVAATALGPDLIAAVRTLDPAYRRGGR